MVHTRIRPFNTRDMYPGKGMDNDLCMAVRAGSHVWLRGQTGFDLEGNMVGIGDPAAQTENAMKCVKILLGEAGAKLEHITKITVYINDRAHREAVYGVIGKWLKGVYPCSTGLIISGFARPEMLMEIDVEAMIPENDA
ncbi:Rid family hydrolase [Noviherbaspirillum saxi]|uniref:RidA family protein n=1 Tax=Noviherbaspirillum saxi TaxID=2320863 RepID=A0A3A3FFI3_9BURK|nr:Rid family hydrolase [Noviherbaspirillum saxi]RJF91807.1 RidA family protein [Noviherbaspirillum saxi]